MSDELPPYIIEAARSGRSKCKGCRRPIAKDSLRLGILVEGVYGPGYLWNHLTCAARRRPEDLRRAYDQEAWTAAKEPPRKVPPLEQLLERSAQPAKKKEKRELPYAEIAPSGRSKCKQCGDPIEEGAIRFVSGREVRFGQQIRTAEVKIHPGCMAQELEEEDCVHDRDNFAGQLRGNSPTLAAGELDRALAQI